MNSLKTSAEYGYVQRGNIVLFQKGPLSQWYGAYKGQEAPMFHGDHTNALYFNCCEQWMMWNKANVFGDIETAAKILSETNPKLQKDFGREVKNFDPARWNEVKEDIVFLGNYMKFTQNSHLTEWMLSYPINTVFAEAAPWDKIWGIGLGPEDPDSGDISKWQGENLLGKALSRVRKLL
jgi:ribA/ribD-fused uncharacterized protein